MPEAADIHGTVFKNCGGTPLTRVLGNDGSAIQQADISSGVYSVYLLDDNDADSRTAVTGHTAGEITIASVIFDDLQIDALWVRPDGSAVDAIGYNFKHVLDVSESQAFTIAGRRYLVEYTLTPVSGQKILIRFRVNCI